MRLVSLTQRFNTMQMHDEVEAFFAEHPAPAAERTVRQSLERIRLNAAWAGAEPPQGSASTWPGAELPPSQPHEEACHAGCN